jgi:hypothetical protein
MQHHGNKEKLCDVTSFHNFGTPFFLSVNANIQADQTVMQPIPEACSICQKTNYIEIWKKKKKVILSVGNVHCIQRCMHSLFSSYLMQPSEGFLWHGKGSPDEILSICLEQENRKMYPQTHSGKLSKKKMPGRVQ